MHGNSNIKNPQFNSCPVANYRTVFQSSHKRKTCCRYSTDLVMFTYKSNYFFLLKWSFQKKWAHLNLFILMYVTMGYFWRLQQERLQWLLIRISTELSHVLRGVVLGKTKYKLWFVELTFTVQCNFRRRPRHRREHLRARSICQILSLQCKWGLGSSGIWRKVE
jgi:hypothetical protein